MATSLKSKGGKSKTLKRPSRGQPPAIAKTPRKRRASVAVVKPAANRQATTAAARVAKTDASKKSAAPAIGREVARSEPAVAAPRRTSRSEATLSATVNAAAERQVAKFGGNYDRDRVVLMVRDSYWLHAFWEITRKSVIRTEAALGQDWYAAKPVLRLIDVTSSDSSSPSECPIRDIEIHGGVNNWYIDVANPPSSYRVDIGFKTAKGRFFVLARSNAVTTPQSATRDQIDGHWSSLKRESERVFALSGGHDENADNAELRSLFEERLRRPMSRGTLSGYGSGALGDEHRRGFRFEIDAELIVYGNTDPSARVMLQDEPVQIRKDGSFTLRFSLPEGRQIIPAIAQTPDGIEERTIILAVERNTKALEPMIHDGQE